MVLTIQRVDASSRFHDVETSLYHFVKDAHFAGVRFYCCSPSDDVYDTRPDDLIAECAGVIGRTQLIEQIMDNEDVKVLSY